MSVRLSTGLPRACSGLMNSTVPRLRSAIETSARACVCETSGERFNVECTSHGLNCHPDDYYRNWPMPTMAEYDVLLPCAGAA